MQLKELYAHLKSNLPAENAELEARIILEDVAKIEWSDLITSPDKAVEVNIVTAIEAMITARNAGKPLSRILGHKEFYGRAFKVTEDTLDPRPDTEILIEKALAFAQIASPQTILDLGTGTGCIITTLLAELPEAKGEAVDISTKALAVAADNANVHGVSNRLTFTQSSWFDEITGKYDLIVSNPPYIDSAVIANLTPEVKNHDPILALDGGKDGLDPYEIIFSKIKNHLNEGGRAFLEIGYDQCGHISRIAENYRIRVEAIYPDLAGNPRVVEISCGDK